MKRVLSCALLLMLMVSSAQAAACYVVKTPGGWLNMRKEPDAKAVIREFIPNGEKVRLVECVNDDWAKIIWKNTTGYVKREFIITLSEKLKAEYPGSMTVYADAGSVYVREKPDPDSRILAVQTQTEPLLLLEEKDGWCYVNLETEMGEGIQGWIPESDVHARRTEPMSAEEQAPSSPVLAGEVRSVRIAYTLPDPGSAKAFGLTSGAAVWVEEIRLPWCCVTAEEKSGWIKAAEVYLTGDVQHTEGEKRKILSASEDEDDFISRDRAREMADAALKKAYPAFDSAGMAVEHERVSEGGQVQDRFDYFQNGTYVYAVWLEAYTGEALFTADYTAFGTVHDAPMPTKRPAQNGSYKPENEKISKSQAKTIAVMALKMEAPGFDAADYSKVQYSECKTAPGLSFEGMFFRLDFYTQDGSGYACCILDARTGVVVYTSVAPGADSAEPDDEESESPQLPSQEAALIGESRARSISDSALSSKYSAFSSTVFSRVWVRYNEADVGFGPHTYHVDYYNEIGDCAYSCVMDAFTGAVKHTNGLTQ